MSQVVTFVCCILLLSACSALADIPILPMGVYIQADGSPINVGRNAAPEVVDWNNDGKKDLLVGQHDAGKVRLYLNTGSNSSPTFGGYSYIRSAGAAISVPYG